MSVKIRQEELIYNFFRNRYHWHYAHNLKEVPEYHKNLQGRTYRDKHLIYRGLFVIATLKTQDEQYIIYDGWSASTTGYRYLMKVIKLCKEWMTRTGIDASAHPISISKDCLTYSRGRSIPLKAKGIWQQMI
jgi:hypothetical protein